MKKIILMAVFALGATVANANSPWFIGGSAQIMGQKTGDDKIGALNINPQVGYMFNDNWGIALDLGFEYAKNDGVKPSNFGVGLSGLYVMKITDKFFYTPTLRIGFKTGDAVFGEEAGAEDMTWINGTLEFLKFEFRPSCHWGITAAFGGATIESAKQKDADDATLTGGLGVNNTTVGFKYYF